MQKPVPPKSLLPRKTPLPELTITGYKEVPLNLVGFGMIEEVGKLTLAYTDYYGEMEGFQELDRFFDSLERMLPLREEGFAKTVSGPQVTYTVHGQSWDTSFTFDAEENTLLFSDYDAYMTLMCSTLGDITRSANEEMAKGYQMKPGTYSYSSGGECTFDFGAYGIDILQNEAGDIFMPCPLFSWIFLPVLSVIGSFNGNAYYVFSTYSELFDGTTGELSEFGKAYYDTPFKDMEEIPERIADLHGNESMFFFDHFYGFGDSDLFEGMKISEYLEEHHPDRYRAFYGTDPEALDLAWDWTLNNFLGDGHTGNYAHAGSYYSSTDYELKEGMSERRQKIYAAREKYATLREEKLGIPADSALSAEDMLQIEGDMAVIRFDQFLYGFTADSGQSKEYYEQYMATDGYCLFANSFLEIEKNPSIKKVVIDLTNNIGGQVSACLDVLTFIMDDVPFGSYDQLTGSEMSITLNGTHPSIRTTEGPSYQRAYDIFVMTSDLSFSCANLFPTVVKASGAATIIGMKSAGGACLIATAITPDGMPIQVSGNTRACLSKGSGKLSNDGGISPDVELDSSYFYDLQKLSDKLNQYVS